MPKPLESGFLLLNYPSHPPPQSRFQLGIFRPSTFPLGVICVASCSQSDSISSIYAEYTSVLSELFPEGSVFPLARNCFVFEEGDGHTNLNIGASLPGLTIIPSMMGNKDLYVGTLISELCSNILGGFSSFVSMQFGNMVPFNHVHLGLRTRDSSRKSSPEWRYARKHAEFCSSS